MIGIIAGSQHCWRLRPGKRRWLVESMGCWCAALCSAKQIVDALCLPIDDVAETVSDMTTHPCVPWAGSFRSPLRKRLDRQPEAVSEFLAA
jgi:hypothetical protein